MGGNPTRIPTLAACLAVGSLLLLSVSAQTAIAQQMADGLHVKLGMLIYASNETPVAKLYFARQASPMLGTDMAPVSSVPESPDLEIRPHKISEEATVYAVFSIE